MFEYYMIYKVAKKPEFEPQDFDDYRISPYYLYDRHGERFFFIVINRLKTKNTIIFNCDSSPIKSFPKSVCPIIHIQIKSCKVEVHRVNY